jgi:hypothetical protein
LDLDDDTIATEEALALIPNVGWHAGASEIELRPVALGDQQAFGL